MGLPEPAGGCDSAVLRVRTQVSGRSQLLILKSGQKLQETISRLCVCVYVHMCVQVCVKYALYACVHSMFM